ncbi:MAG TPA: RNA methyltransferase [Acidimicrobiia bacterium]|nr:RNA methyltransferase [Acidimicrobiia bacterium]
MEPVPVTDPDDPRVDDYRELHDARARRRMETGGAGAGFFVAEGAHALRRLLASGRRIRSVLIDGLRLEALGGELADLEAPVLLADQPTLRAVAGFPVHRGVLAAADRWPLPDAGRLLGAARRVAVLEDINDHENLGVIFRNAGSLGLDAVLLSPRCCDPLYRRSVRVSMGHVLGVPWTRLEPWPEALHTVREAGFTVAALTPATDAEPLPGWSPAPGERVAVLLGAEGPGLSPAALAAADRRLTIPMRTAADSLNVGSAAAIAFYALSVSTTATTSTETTSITSTPITTSTSISTK